MKKYNLFFLGLLFIHISCAETDLCELYNGYEEANFLLINLLDKDTGDKILFGDNKQIDISEISIKGKNNENEYKDLYFAKVREKQDFVLLVSIAEIFSLDVINRLLYDEVVISYNNKYPSDTINIQYMIAGYCENLSLKYDYNILSNNKNSCLACFKDIFEIKK